MSNPRHRTPPRMPPGFAVGDRVVSNKRFNAVYARTKVPRHGTVIGATYVGAQLRVKLDDCQDPAAFDPRLFDRETDK